MEDFKAAVAGGDHEKQGWVSMAYATSKAGVTAATRCIAEEWEGKGSKTLINSCCPGYVKVSRYLFSACGTLEADLNNRPT